MSEWISVRAMASQKMVKSADVSAHMRVLTGHSTVQKLTQN